jgi:hypothetical protein
MAERTPHPSSESCDAIYKDEGSMGVFKGKMRGRFSILLAKVTFVKVGAGEVFWDEKWFKTRKDVVFWSEEALPHP